MVYAFLVRLSHVFAFAVMMMVMMLAVAVVIGCHHCWTIGTCSSFDSIDDCRQTRRQIQTVASSGDLSQRPSGKIFDADVSGTRLWE